LFFEVENKNVLKGSRGLLFGPTRKKFILILSIGVSEGKGAQRVGS
jgi:hypothetical protein